MESSSFSVLSFCLFMGFSKQEYWSRLPFPSPVDHGLSELSTMTCPSSAALHSMADSFIELDKAMVHAISLVSFLLLWFSYVCPLTDKDKRLIETSWWQVTADWYLCRRDSNIVLAQSLCPGVEKVCLSPPRSLAGMRFYSKCDFAPPKMEKRYTVSKNKNGSWLWLRSWTPYCQIHT